MDNLRDYLRGLITSPGSTPDTLHVVLRGSPGVGKTSIAEVITEVYHILGFIPKNRCVRIVRENIVGKAVGETEKIVSDLVKGAEGGVLFVDEAYNLADDVYGKRSVVAP
jgi:stage V sporulation protein K